MDDLISRQAAIDTLATGEELLRRVLDDMDVVGNEREKYEWGLGLIESYIADMKDLPSAQPLDPCETCLHKGKGWDEVPCDGCTGTESKYEPMVSPDGTLTVTVPEGTKVKRVLVEEEGTTWGFLLYPEQPALKGKWERPLRKKAYERICSECGAKSWYCGTGDYVYCPWCGSYNGGGDNEGD